MKASIMILLAVAIQAAAQTAGPRGRFDVGPTDTPPAIEPSGPMVPSAPNSSVGAAKPVPLDPEIVQASGSVLPPMIKTPIPNLSLFDIASGSDNFTTFVTATKAAGIDMTLKTQSPLTVFAPSNAAFAALPSGVLQNLLLPENRDALRRLLTYHIVPRRVTASQIIPGRLPTLQGETVEILAGDRGRMTVEGARIVQTDVFGSNGVIHAVDKVLVPRSLILENFANRPAALR